MRFERTRAGTIRFAAAALAAALFTTPAAAEDPDGYSTWETDTRPGEGSLPSVRENLGAIMGSLDRSWLDERIREHMPALREAYEKRLKKKPAIKGKVTFKFTIQADGSVTNIELKGSQLADQPLEAELQQIMSEVSFATEHPRDGIVIVTYPMVFSPRR